MGTLCKNEITTTLNDKLQSLTPHFIIALLVIGLSLFSSVTNDLLSLNRELVGAGQWWRVITGHYVHLSWPHTLLNFSGVAVVAITFIPLFKSQYPTTHSFQILFFYLSSNLFISTLILILSPDIKNYLGLSGTLYGLFIFYLIKELSYNKALAITGLTLVLLKVAFDFSPYNQNLATAKLIGGSVANDAHLYGAIFGLFSGLISYIPKKK